MKLFMTGATGYIGSAIAGRAVEEGHEVTGLAHRDAVADQLIAAGVTAVRGDVRRPAEFTAALREADAVIHAANTQGDDAADADTRFVHGAIEALEGSGQAFVYTSGVWVLGPTNGVAADELSPPNPVALVAWRADLESWLVEAAEERRVRTVIVRPGIVYGRGGGIPAMMAAGQLPVIGDGMQRWPVVHVDDLAALYLAAAERAPAGAVLHGVGGHVTAGELGAKLGAQHVVLDEARARLGHFADALAMDQGVSSRRTRSRTGWVRAAPSMLDADDLATVCC